MQTKILMALVMLIVAILLGLSAEDEMDIGTKPPWCKNLQYSRQTCNPPEPGHPNCAHTWEEHCILWQKMSDATKAAHAAEEQPFDMWIFDIARTQSEETRQMRLQQIVHAYDECFTQRVRANDICGEMRGTVDKGHRDAPFTRCRDRKDAVLARFLV
ncbi:hypothetical protein PMIN01_10403 [Paraphaeosphaeria minitans]|uniref:Uncharacterized protein n=1 Tax=Paraphaeosphaeria minitans TaxID=565426 RepID=A0A9P6GA32_9PLEO|nr:hypothetical protein PMIN01_10403 [Paraphaeosphaeria minitans]